MKPYFHVHAIVVLTNNPLRQVLHKPETSGHLLKWLIELCQFDITYTSKVLINGQAMADFMVEFTYYPNERDQEQEIDGESEENGEGEATWELHVDRSWNDNRVGAGVVMIALGGTKMYCAIMFNFKASKNEAKCKAILPIEMKLNSFCLKNFNEEANGKTMAENLDLMEERKDVAQMRLVVSTKCSTIL
uniref:Uncharacterized protein n=1 Tax=Cannabis sativa TaxID=3483 RepID=A0A803NPB0_CANSA